MRALNANAVTTGAHVEILASPEDECDLLDKSRLNGFIHAVRKPLIWSAVGVVVKFASTSPTTACCVCFVRTEKTHETMSGTVCDGVGRSSCVNSLQKPVLALSRMCGAEIPAIKCIMGKLIKIILNCRDW